MRSLPTIDDDPRAVVQANLRLDDEALTLLSERALRNYDGVWGTFALVG